MTQPTFADLERAQRRENRPTIRASFAHYDAEHPEVYELFKMLARDLRARGLTRYSADAVLHQIRWRYRVERGDNDFAVNNSFSSRYARKLIAEDPDFAEFFEQHRLKTE